MSPTLTDLEALVRQAGAILRAGYGLGHQVAHKGAIDLVTEVDHRSEAFLIGEIRSRFPGDGIVAEESGGQAGQNSHIWYIDPLDGTVNYARGVPFFSVSLAYGENGLPCLGVVYEPMRDEMFSAERGKGAFINGQPIHVSETRDLDQSLLVTGFAYDIRTNPNNNLDHYAHFAVRTLGVRRLGSAALDLCYVACGRIDGYWELYLQPWDMAAGLLIAQEAGALVTRADGSPAQLVLPCSALAANPQIHAQMLDVLRGG